MVIFHSYVSLPEGNINPAIGISMSESHSTGVMNAAPTGAAHSLGAQGAT